MGPEGRGGPLTLLGIGPLAPWSLRLKQPYSVPDPNRNPLSTGTYDRNACVSPIHGTYERIRPDRLDEPFFREDLAGMSRQVDKDVDNLWFEVLGDAQPRARRP